MKQYLRELPPIHELQQDERFHTYVKEQGISFEKVTDWLRLALTDIREQLVRSAWTGELTSQAFKDAMFEKIEVRFQASQEYYLKRVINGTGTILHTNLGRARLSQEAIEQVVLTAANYSNLEYNLKSGKRGSRHDSIESVIKEATGAEAAMVVNNNAAAVYLVLKALARHQEVVVSRGELVEIGGSFRVSSIMEESGAILTEIGTTNKTHFYDYENAITDETAMIMKVHTSNFKTVGFTSAVSVSELVPLREQNKDLIIYEDLGSGAIYDFRKHGIGEEPTVAQALEHGADLVTFSGDKLLGGPQAGIIAGKQNLIELLKKHQLARVLRVDKMTLAALEATLKPYVYQESLPQSIPTVGAILASEDDIRDRALEFVNEMDRSAWEVELIEGQSQIGGGTMPEVEIPTTLVALSHQTLSAQAIFDQLKAGTPPIISRLKDNQVMIDFRTIASEDLPIMLECFSSIK